MGVVSLLSKVQVTHAECQKYMDTDMAAEVQLPPFFALGMNKLRVRHCWHSALHSCLSWVHSVLSLRDLVGEPSLACASLCVPVSVDCSRSARSTRRSQR